MSLRFVESAVSSSCQESLASRTPMNTKRPEADNCVVGDNPDPIVPPV